MKYITIKDLKREAKSERKNNNIFKNHMDSLNYVATKHNYTSWTHLLDDSAIIIKKQDPIYYLNDLIDEIIKQRELFVLLVVKGTYKQIAEYMNERFLCNIYNYAGTDYNYSLMWREKAKKWIEAIALLYTYKRDSSNRSLMENYLDLINWNLDGYLEIEINKYYAKLKNNDVFSELITDIIVDFKRSTKSGDSQSFETLQQWGFLRMQYSDIYQLTEQINILGITSNNRQDIIKFIEKRINYIQKNNYLDPNKKAINYINSISNDK